MSTTQHTDPTAGTLQVVEAPGALATAEHLQAALDIFERGGRANSTNATYGAAMRLFWAWGRATGLHPEERLPATWETVVAFMTGLYEGFPDQVEGELLAQGAIKRSGPFTLSTVRSRFYALATAHKLCGIPPEENPCLDPRTKEWMKRLSKTAGREGRGGKRRKSALTADRVTELLETIAEVADTTSPAAMMRAARDGALMAGAFAAGGRRVSEMLALTVEDLEIVTDPGTGGRGYMLTVQKSKTDQEGEGLSVGLHGKGAEAMRAWLDISRVDSGPIFQGVTRGGKLMGEAITRVQAWRIVKRWCGRAGLDPRRFSPHSFRSGYVTEAGIQGVHQQEAMSATGHRTVDVFNSYYRTGAQRVSKAAHLLPSEEGSAS